MMTSNWALDAVILVAVIALCGAMALWILEKWGGE